MRKAGKIIFFIGTILLIVGVVAGIVMIVQSVKAGQTMVDSVVVGNTTTVTSEAGERWAVLADTAMDAGCSIEGPEGPAPFDPGSRGSTVTVNSDTFRNQGVFEAPVAGDYVVECSDVISYMSVVPDGTFGKFGGFLAGGIVALVLGGLMFPVAVIGLIVWLVGRSRENQPPTPPAPGYPAPGGQGGYPGPGQQGGYPGPGQGGYPGGGAPGGQPGHPGAPGGHPSA